MSTASGLGYIDWTIERHHDEVPFKLRPRFQKILEDTRIKKGTLERPESHGWGMKHSMKLSIGSIVSVTINISLLVDRLFFKFCYIMIFLMSFKINLRCSQ